MASQLNASLRSPASLEADLQRPNAGANANMKGSLLIGVQGEPGPAGNGIASVVLNADYTLTLTFDDGTQYTTPSIRGEKGERGDDASVTVDSAFSSTSTNPVQNKVITKVIHDLELMIGEEIWPYLVPKVNANNNGQIMQVVGGKWVPVTIDLENGEDGFSPTITVEAIEGGNKIAITDVNGTKYVYVMDGEDGKDGKNGKDGVDGRTPVKGTDYFTKADKTEMVASVIAALPVYDGSVTSV